MIITTTDQFKRYYSLNPHFKKVGEWLSKLDISTLHEGRNDVDGDNVYVNFAKGTMEYSNVTPMEAHKQYIDIHVPLVKREKMGWRSIETCQNLSTEYSEKDDYMLFSDTPDLVVEMPVGTLVLVFPEDPHSPMVGEGNQKKLIIKVRTE